MPRHHLTDREWNAIRHFLPAQRSGKRGRPWAEHRQTISGILWILKTGSPWRDLPEEFGKWQTVYNRFRRWIDEGLWERIYQRLLQRAKCNSKVNFDLWCVDGSVVRAHRCASVMVPQSEENDELLALGRSRGGYSTKIHLMADAFGNVLSVTLTPGQTHESTEFETLVSNCRLNLYRKQSRPAMIAGDKGYSSTAIRESIRQQDMEPVIPVRSNEQPDPSFDREVYRRRNIVERVIGWLKESRRVATRYDKLPSSYLTFLQLAAMRRLIKNI